MERFLAESGGLPRIVKPKSVKDEAIRLLHIAAEIEHALMVQYLYAAFTLTSGADPKYRGTLLVIAMEEMGHLVTVQHLLRLLGADPHLDRDDLLPGSGKEPATFALEPVTPDSLAKYVVIESPLDEQITGNAKILYKRAKDRIGSKSMANLNRVGALYTAIYWLFMKTDEPDPDEPWPLNPEEILLKNPDLKDRHLADADFADAQQVSPFMTLRDDWGGGPDTVFVDQTIDRKSAKSALSRISSQGEGVSSDPALISHFQKFLELFGSAEQHPPSTIGVTVQKPKSAGNEAAQGLMELFSTRYQILLLLIDLTLRIPQGEASFRTQFARLAIAEMKVGVRDVADAMLKLKDGPTGGPVAPPFTLPGGAWPEDSLPNIGASIKQLRRLLAQSIKLDETLRAISPNLMKANLDALKTRNARIETTLGSVPAS